MIRTLLVVALLSLPVAAHADYDDEDHGDYAAGRRTNETWSDYYSRRQDEVERQYQTDDDRHDRKRR